MRFKAISGLLLFIDWISVLLTGRPYTDSKPRLFVSYFCPLFYSEQPAQFGLTLNRRENKGANITDRESLERLVAEAVSVAINVRR